MPKKIDPTKVNKKEFLDTRISVRLDSFELKEYVYKNGPTEFINQLIRERFEKDNSSKD